MHLPVHNPRHWRYADYPWSTKDGLGRPVIRVEFNPVHAITKPASLLLGTGSGFVGLTK
jgi:hypothetical protein